MTLTNSYCKGEAAPLAEQTIGEMFDDIVTKYANFDAVVSCDQGQKLSWAECGDRVDRFAAGLVRLGVKRGDRVAIWSPNCTDWIVTQFATAKIGAVLVCINPAYRKSELEFALNKVECTTLVCAEVFKSSNYIEMVLDVAPEISTCKPGLVSSKNLPHLKNVITLGANPRKGFFNFDRIVENSTDKDLSRLDELASQLSCKDIINIQFTSGTTGLPKGASLSHYNILNNAMMAADVLSITPSDRLCLPVPLYHCFGMVIGTLACMTKGACTVLPSDGFDAEKTLSAIESERCTLLYGVPTMFISQLEHAAFEQFSTGTLRSGVMAGAPCPVEIMKRVISEMNMRDVLIAYGQTETSPINHITTPNDSLTRRVETVGKAAPNCEIKIIDDEGNIAPLNSRGEVCVRGYNVMAGYWEDAHQTEQTIDKEGWLHSGDLGEMDQDGYVKITGRIKDMIIRGGENIYPREIEEYLYTHPDIHEAQVFGIPDARFGEEVAAWIKLASGKIMKEQDVKDFCKGKIAHYKVPKHIAFVDEYPMTVTGKIQKYMMRDAMISELGLTDSALSI